MSGTITLENPLQEGSRRIEWVAEPCVVVIFGASGDLTKRKLLPALYNLADQHLLSPGFSVVGFARTEKSHEVFRDEMRESVDRFSETGPANKDVWDSFAQGLFYISADPRSAEGYAKLSDLLAQIDRERGTAGNRVFYLSTPPSLYGPIIAQLGAAGLAKPATGWTRIIIEKPFGKDLDTAVALNKEVAAVFDEEQVYRIDHYLGKETVQNIMVHRFSNGIFEPLWNRQYIDHIQITAAEAVSVEDRGGYYEEAGALRDMIQNHLLQVFTLVAMEPPVSMDSESIRDEKNKVMMAVRPIKIEEIDRVAVRGQYGAGSVGGKPVIAYRSAKGVNPESNTETYAALKLYIDNWRWADVPFYLRSGKSMPRRVSEVAIQFKRAPHMLFKGAANQLEPNVMVLRIQPDEGISLKFGAKQPGQAVRIRQVNMDFEYGTSFARKSPEAYERLLLDCMLGDATLFARRDMVERGWALITPILEYWKNTKPINPFPNYEAGTWGPREADEMMERDGRRWRRP